MSVFKDCQFSEVPVYGRFESMYVIHIEIVLNMPIK